ncbi:hypothetical protein [Microvirga mediterraneensis]|uniref:Uncharacterized protein n=1 Tax=Microvirga mediterraneensis TaxID=2754695 RepID=A0A838BRS1_9HYPH|nr:hypothetical protein [Microvirga mediterraneensis]MBA1157749.1 hypothetical protein [Microvirga mediterraneensis]
MSKRILIGRDAGGDFRIRSSAAGYDVETAPLDQILFDAGAIPGRIITQGARYCEWNPYQASQPNQPETTTFAHGVPSGLSFIILAIGKAQYSDGSTPDDWRYWTWTLFTPQSTERIVVSTNLGNPTMRGRYCTPFRFSGDDGAGFPNWGGWWLSWNGTNITVTNNCANGVWLRWQALEV